MGREPPRSQGPRSGPTGQNAVRPSARYGAPASAPARFGAVSANAMLVRPHRQRGLTPFSSREFIRSLCHRCRYHPRARCHALHTVRRSGCYLVLTVGTLRVPCERGGSRSIFALHLPQFILFMDDRVIAIRFRGVNGKGCGCGARRHGEPGAPRTGEAVAGAVEQGGHFVFSRRK